MKQATNARALSAKVDAGLSSAFEGLANIVTSRPLLTIIATTGLAFALAPGMVMGGKESNGENLWMPQDTESKGQQTWVLDTFGAGDRRAKAYSTNNGANLLTRESLAALEKLQTGMLSVSATCDVGSCDGKTVTYEKVRAKRSSILSIWNDNAPPSGANILADVNDESKWFSTEGEKLKVSDMLGGVQYDSTGKIVAAEAFLTTVWLKNERETLDDSKVTDPSSDAWEMEFDTFVYDFSDIALPTHYPYTKAGASDAGGTAIKKDVGMLGLGYMLLIGFSVIVLSHHKRVHSNGVIAMASVFSVGLSIVSTFGICGYAGVKQNPVTTTLYVVLLGIGVDDCYVIMGEYGHSEGTPRERVVKALTKAGTSIAVTSMTDAVAFAAGVSSTLPAIRDFCIFASVGILFDFLYQSTFLVAVLLLRAKGAANNRPDWLCCIKVDPESTGCCGCNAPVCSRESRHVCCPCSWDNGQGKSDSLTRNVLNRITNFTLTPIGNVVVAAVSVLLLTGGIVGIPNLKTDFDMKWFTPDDSPYKDTYTMEEKYFPLSGGLPVYIYTKPGDYATAHSDGSLSALYDRVATCSWTSRSVGNWYSEFVKDAGRSTRSKASESAFASEVKLFVSSPAGARFVNDVAFGMDSNGDVSSIRGSKAMYLSKETNSGREDVEMTEAMRSCVGDKPLTAFAYSTPFLYFDGLAVVDKECIQNVLVACLCVFVVNLIMLADILAATLVLAMVGLADLCILGYMAHWGLDFNSVTAVNLVLAVGLSVDYSAHIAHSFLVAKGAGVERAKHAVDHIGKDVFNGGFSTFLAVLPLALSKSYVFRVFFQMWFMIIMFGLYFGVIVLPVVLSLVGRFVGSQEVNADPGSLTSDQKVADAGVTEVKPKVLVTEAKVTYGKPLGGNKAEVYIPRSSQGMDTE